MKNIRFSVVLLGIKTPQRELGSLHWYMTLAIRLVYCMLLQFFMFLSLSHIQPLLLQSFIKNGVASL